MNKIQKRRSLLGIQTQHSLQYMNQQQIPPIFDLEFLQIFLQKYLIGPRLIFLVNICSIFTNTNSKKSESQTKNIAFELINALNVIRISVSNGLKHLRTHIQLSILNKHINLILRLRAVRLQSIS